MTDIAKAESAIEAGDYEAACGWLDHQDLPAQLWEWWWEQGWLRNDELKQMILPAWCGYEGGPSGLGEWRWLTMWKAVGFVSSDGGQAPTDRVVLWRGAPTWTNGRGMSWTLDSDRAEWFRARCELFGFGPASLYRAVVHPHAVLGVVNDRNEAEVIVNPRCLRGRHSPVAVDPPPDPQGDGPARETATLSGTRRNTITNI